ncbi:hypothetical protein BDP27DRAFT_1303912, partial [Rhodocollybia butyracea]
VQAPVFFFVRSCHRAPFASPTSSGSFNPLCITNNRCPRLSLVNPHEKTPNKSTCQICNQVESRYTCSACFVPYCSVVCFKNHKSSSEGPGHGCTGTKTAADESSSAKSSLAAKLEIIHSSPIDPALPALEPNSNNNTNTDFPVTNALNDPPALKPLTSLRWPYIADDEPAYPDPLQRNDPKPLRTRHYEAIATSAAVRKAHFTPSPIPGHPDLPNTALRNLLISIDKLSGIERERALQRALGSTHPHSHSQPEVSEDVLALRALAEAIEGAVRDKDGKDGKGTLGLDWDSL